MTSFPAKLLLFGEHTVNLGSQALAVPLHLFSGKWAYAPHLGPAELAARQQQLPQFADYLEQLQKQGNLLIKLDVAAFKQAQKNGLIFESNIPTGYGVGSSGALVAAVLKNWVAESREIPFPAFKKALAQMEVFFHGTSSGTDPLVCYLQKPVLLGGEAGAEIVELPANIKPCVEGQTVKHGYCIFLLDTGIQRQATPFIAYFLKQMKGHTLSFRVQMSLIPDVQKAIGSFLDGDSATVYDQFHAISLFQYKFLRGLIPVKYRKFWASSLENDLFKLKTCGAGGGGFLLGMTKDIERTTDFFAAHFKKAKSPVSVLEL